MAQWRKRIAKTTNDISKDRNCQECRHQANNNNKNKKKKISTMHEVSGWGGCALMHTAHTHIYRPFDSEMHKASSYYYHFLRLLVFALFKANVTLISRSEAGSEKNSRRNTHRMRWSRRCGSCRTSTVTPLQNARLTRCVQAVKTQVNSISP